MKSFWKIIYVFVTGATCFIGINLISELLKKEAKIITLSRKQGSITHFKFVNNIVEKNKINVIYHLAGQPLVETGRKNPLSTFETNIKGAWNILEAARINNVDKIIIASTTHVYGDNPHLPYKEEYYPQPSRPYETSKACADLLAQSFADTYNLPVEVPRFSNIYGPNDLNFSRIIPKVMKSIMNNANPEIWDTGAMRDFLYIKDAIDAYLLIAEKELPKHKRLRILNIGSGKPIYITELVKKIIKLSGNKNLSMHLYKIPEERKQEIPKQFVSIGKAKKVLGWKPKTSLDSGIKKTLLWYKDYLR